MRYWVMAYTDTKRWSMWLTLWLMCVRVCCISCIYCTCISMSNFGLHKKSKWLNLPRQVTKVWNKVIVCALHGAMSRLFIASEILCITTKDIAGVFFSICYWPKIKLLFTFWSGKGIYCLQDDPGIHQTTTGWLARILIANKFACTKPCDIYPSWIY